MTDSSWVVRTATPADRATAIDVLAEAFLDDPMVGWLLGRRRINRVRVRHFFAAYLPLEMFEAGRVDVAADSAGVAVWYPPGTWDPTQVGGTGLAHYTLALGLRRGLRAKEFRAAMTLLRPAAPHWYLNFLGVHPSLAGQGIGTALLRTRLREIDRLGEPVHLNTTKSSTLPLYERHGFEITGQTHVLERAPVQWPMWRHARQRG